DRTVTGVQTCALPISTNSRPSGATAVAVGSVSPVARTASANPGGRVVGVSRGSSGSASRRVRRTARPPGAGDAGHELRAKTGPRSEEGRVGGEGGVGG